MSFNIVDLVKDQISDQLLGTMGSVLGTEGSQTTGALSGALPGLLSGLMNSARNPTGAGALFNAVQQQDDNVLGNIGNLLGSDQSSTLASQGTSMLTGVLGSGALGQLAGVIANFAGISRGNSSSLLGMLAPIIIGVIKKKVFEGGMNASSLADMLASQKDNVEAAMPSGFADQLKSAGFFDSIAAAPQAAVSAPEVPQAPAYQAPVAPSATSGGGLMKWLLPLVAVVVLGWLGMKFLGNKDVTTDAVESAADAAGAASQAVSSLSDDAMQAARDAMPANLDFDKLKGDLEGVFGSTTDALSGITDAESARAALPSIEQASGSVSRLGGIISRLPDAAKGPIGTIVNNGLAALQPLIDKVSAIPGVGDIIRPIVGPMLETLQGLAG